MEASPLKILLYFLPLFLIWFLLARRRLELQRAHLAAKQKAVREGIAEPASLHPAIDPNLCIGCRSCLNACPEQAEHNTLGFINGKAELINPADCIGHGACKASCPVDAIKLVFGSAKRGVDIPEVKPNFETNVPGVFISGELGGMGLIRNAVEQGRQAIEAIKRRNASNGGQDLLDVVIVGAGPAGFSASLAALQHGLKFVTLEQYSLGGAISHYPRRKVTMTQPARLPLFGEIQLSRTDKEDLLALLAEIERKAGLRINYQERLEEVTPNTHGYIVKTSRGSYRTRSVLLALGRRGTPRTIGVPGEELPKVVYRLIDPEQYRGQRVLVVGGGDSALEAATILAAEEGVTVCLAHRSDGFGRAKAANRTAVQDAHAAGRLRVLLRTKLQQITPAHVQLEREGRTLRLPNDAVIICAGGELPTPLLKKIGIRIETKYGTA